MKSLAEQWFEDFISRINETGSWSASEASGPDSFVLQYSDVYEAALKKFLEYAEKEGRNFPLRVLNETVVEKMTRVSDLEAIFKKE